MTMKKKRKRKLLKEKNELWNENSPFPQKKIDPEEKESEEELLMQKRESEKVWGELRRVVVCFSSSESVSHSSAEERERRTACLSNQRSGNTLKRSLHELPAIGYSEEHERSKKKRQRRTRVKCLDGNGLMEGEKGNETFGFGIRDEIEMAKREEEEREEKDLL
jgi:hypothetical protein